MVTIVFKKKYDLKIDMLQNLDYNQAFTNELNFGIKLPIRSWYAFKQISHCRQNL